MMMFVDEDDPDLMFLLPGPNKENEKCVQGNLFNKYSPAFRQLEHDKKMIMFLMTNIFCIFMCAHIISLSLKHA